MILVLAGAWGCLGLEQLGWVRDAVKAALVLVAEVEEVWCPRGAVLLWFAFFQGHCGSSLTSLLPQGSEVQGGNNLKASFL